MKNLIYSISTAVFLFSNVAAADIYDPINQVNNSFAATINVMHFNYREDVVDAWNTPPVSPNGSVPPGNVEQYGNAYSLALNVRNVFFSRLYIDLLGEYATGKISYDGYKKYSQPWQPLQMKNMSNFFNIDTKLGLILLDTEYFQLIPYAGIGFRYWSFESGNDYKYYNFKPIVGTRLNLAFFEDLVLSPYINLGKTLGAHSKAKEYDRNNNNIYLGSVTHNLSSKLIREIGLEINYRLDHELFLTANVGHTNFGFGKSSWQDVGDAGDKVIEPNSTTNELRFGLGIRFSLR